MSQGFEFVLEQLADGDRAVRTINLAQLSDLPRNQVDRLREVWIGLDSQRRLGLVSAMVEQAETNIHLNFHCVLREFLYDVEPGVRKAAVEGLWEDERPSLVGPLVRLVAQDPAPQVRAAAATSLGRFILLGVLGEIQDHHARQAEQALWNAWSRPNEAVEVRRRVLEGLGYLGNPEVHALLDQAYYDDHELMRQSALFAMGRSADRRWGRYILAELRNTDAAMRFEAAGAAGELGLTSAVRPLIRLLDDPDGNVRETAALALGKIGGPEARRALEACLQSDDERLAEAAGEALEELRFNASDHDDALLEIPVSQPGTKDAAAPEDLDEFDEYLDEYESDEDSEADLLDEEGRYDPDEEPEDVLDGDENDEWDDDEPGELD